MTPTPDVGKHLRDLIGGIVMELATAKALIEAQEQALAEANARRGSPDGAQSADGPAKEGT